MTTTLCTTCGAPLDTPFCSECGTAGPKAFKPDPDATVVRSTPLVPPWVQFPPPPLVLPKLTASDDSDIAPEPTAALPPLFAPPPPIHGPASMRRPRNAWIAVGAGVALGVGLLTVLLLRPDAPSHPSVPVSAAPATSAAGAAGAASTSLEPGTRSALVPAWANANVGRLVRAQIVLGADGIAEFATQGHNTCAVVGAEVQCVATPLWHASDPSALPPTDPTCSEAADGRWAVFAIAPTGMGTAATCTATPTALTLGAGTVPHNTVIGMGSTGILCYVDVRPGAPAAQTGVACWNPSSNHGFLITHQDKRLW